MNNISQNTQTTSTRGRGRTSRGGSSNRASGSGNPGARLSNRSAGLSDDGPTQNHKWTHRTTQILLDLIIAELEAEDYTVRLPLGPGKRRIEENFYEMTGESVKWKPEMKGRLDYLRSLWYYNNMLINRTGVSVVDGKIDMKPAWWEDRCAEVAPSNRKYITVLQNNPLPFKTSLDQIYGEHDVEQDDHYSPHMLGVHLRNTDNEETNYDDVVEGETEEYGRTSFHQENLNQTASDDDLPSRSQVRSTREATRHSPYITRRSSSRGHSTSSRRTHMRRANFEAQLDGRFQRMEESRGQLLDVVRSRQSSKPTYGDALAVLESLPIKPMKTFWWEANKISSPTICKWSTTSKQQGNVQ